jgi:glycosyltransferase involved in cell wall biosynthesis
MKILFLTADYPNYYSSLAGIFCRDHAFALKSVCSDVVVLAVVPVSLKQIWAKKKIKFGLVKEIDNNLLTYKYVLPSIPKLRLLNLLILTRTILRLYNIVKSDVYKPDLIQIHEYQAGYGGYKISKKERIPYFITEHLTVFFNSSLTLAQLNFARLAFCNAASCIGVSKNLCDFLSAKFNKTFNYVPNVYNFDDIDILISEPNKIVKICTVGGLEKRKNHAMLIRAVKKLVNDIKAIELHIGGGGPEFENLERLTNSLELTEKVIFYGEMEHSDAINLINSCDLFVLSSTYETFGIVLIEAMACGKPVVSTKCGGPESIINSEKVGILVENNEDDMYKGLRDMIERIKAGYYDATYLKSYVKNTYSKESVGKQYINLYENILHGRMPT